ncbi:MAG: ChaN family lipoprotein [Schleiferiaceae bacterium]|nr:ChaN family lipoprotein [Schleiferiaceae bacterium]
MSIKKHVLFALALIFINHTNGQDLSAYQIFNAKGKKVSFKKMLKELGSADVLMFGELHDNPIAHWMQLETTVALHKTNSLTLGAEMFETDNQEALNNYLTGNINQQGLDTTARLWRNYKTDYKPLVEFAKENSIPFIATNIPRRYASMVYRGGFEALDTLSDSEKKWIAPLPILYDAEVAFYKNILKMSHGHGGENLPKAQAIKDATMAHNILKHWNPKRLFVHYQGSYHSDNHEGILWYLHQLKPDLNYMSITTKLQENVSKLEDEHKGTADFIIVVDKDMTKTY